MPPVTLDEIALKSLVDLVVIRNRLASALVSTPHLLTDRIAEARRAYSAGIEQSLLPYRNISVIDQVIRGYEKLVNTPGSDKLLAAFEDPSLLL